jgi:hypothetical protein
LRFHLTPVRMAIIRGCRVGEEEGKPYILLVAMYLSVVTMQISMAFPQKNKNRATI